MTKLLNWLILLGSPWCCYDAWVTTNPEKLRFPASVLFLIIFLTALNDLLFKKEKP